VERAGGSVDVAGSGANIALNNEAGEGKEVLPLDEVTLFGLEGV